MQIKNYIQKLCSRALLASKKSGTYSADQKNKVLKSICKELDKNTNIILKNNLIDVKNANNKGLKDSMIDRLIIDKKRIDAMIDGLNKIIKIPDTLYKQTKSKKQNNGINLSQMRVPLGVIGMIYESRPNVTIDAAGLCLKSGNSVILRGGSESINTNKALIKLIKKALQLNRFDVNTVQLVETTSREAVTNLLLMDKYIDVIIPRGGKGLIEKIIKYSKIPMIKHLDGNCHVYIDKSAQKQKAINISINSKTQRYGVCNAMETLLIHKNFSKTATQEILSKFLELGVKIKGCNSTKKLNKKVIRASENDWYEEYLAPIVAVKIVKNIDEAIIHIQKYGSMHTDAIISSDKQAIDKFTKLVNSSSVMVNTSTRFADGYEYGLGAEIGISTDKLHARGPVGLDGLTNLKYIVTSLGKVRN